MSKPKRKEGYSYINIVAVIACFGVVVIVLTVMFANYMLSKPINVPEDNSALYSEESETSDQTDNESVTETSNNDDLSNAETSETSDTVKKYTTAVYAREEIHKGDLIVVNSDTRYNFAVKPDLVNINDKNRELPDDEYPVGIYKLSDTNLEISSHVMPHLTKMLADLNTFAESSSLTIASAYRSKEKQQSLYESNKDKDMAGASDLNTGLSFRCTVYPQSDGKVNQGKFAWLTENCKSYGFIIRYPEGTNDITKHDSSYAHFRYIGEPHAYLVALNNYCLEEYAAVCRSFSYDAPREFEYENVLYLIYYVPASDGEFTEIKIPEGKEYTVSGDNIGGFIVTVKMAEKTPQ